MATFKFKPVGNPDQGVISKRAMRKIVKSKDAMIIHCKNDIKNLLDENDDLIRYCERLKHERKQYLILSVITTIFGVAGFVAGMCG